MTLHETVESAKKTWLGIGIGLAGVIVLIILFRIGIVIKDAIFPPQVIPPNQLYGKLSPLEFPANASNATYVYKVDTLTGTLPPTGTGETDFPDRLNVYKIIHNPPDLLALDKAKSRIRKIEFVGLDGTEVPEIKLTEPFYQWNDNTGIKRKIIINTFSFDFDMTSDYLTSLTVLGGQKISNETAAITTAESFLSDMQQFSTDIDLAKIKDPDKEVGYVVPPQLFTITNGALEKVTSLSEAKVIRVDLYQKDLDFELDTGQSWNPKKKMTLPILYPNPPHSIMNFLVASGQQEAEIVEAHFKHHELDRNMDQIGVYPIKTADEAFNELNDGGGYIAASPYAGADNQVLINEVYLAYYLGSEDQEYLMPIIVFQDRKGFFAYVSAVRENPPAEPTATE